VDRAIGLVILAFYVASVVGLAGLVTYGVIRLFPVKNKPDEPEGPSDDGTGEAQGRLFRRSKRATAS
jgi:hypothetical protein